MMMMDDRCKRACDVCECVDDSHAQLGILGREARSLAVGLRQRLLAVFVRKFEYLTVEL